MPRHSPLSPLDRYLGVMPAVEQDAMGLKLVSFNPAMPGRMSLLTSR